MWLCYPKLFKGHLKISPNAAWHFPERLLQAGPCLASRCPPLRCPSSFLEQVYGARSTSQVPPLLSHLAACAGIIALPGAHGRNSGKT